MSSVLVQPQTANIMNAVMCGLMSFGLLMTPQKFMQGGQYQNPWFSNIPENRDNKLYYVGQLMAFLMLGGCVVPTLISPNSQFLCYQMVTIHVVNLIQTLVFMCTDKFKDAKPDTATGKGQWYFMTVLSAIFGLVTMLACVHPTDNVVDSRETYLSKSLANTVMLVFSSTFGVMFTLFPQHLLSMFWDEEQEDPQDEAPVAQVAPKKFMGFKLLNLTDLERWWSLCIGTTILGLNFGMLLDWNIAQPLYTAGSLTTVSTLTLLNMHQVTMRPYKSISSRHVWMSWLPNLLMSGAMAGILASALLYV
tara:strand:+ start:888 stop:1805 length:918 start_codon:yes stop_codon:yes gene_type:complete